MGKVSSVVGGAGKALPQDASQPEEPGVEAELDEEGFVVGDYFEEDAQGNILQPLITNAAADFSGTWESMEQKEQAITETLLQPLDTSLVKQREGYGRDKRTGKTKMLDYLEHPTVTRTLNRIFGFGGWSREVVSVTDYFDNSPEGLKRADAAVPRAVRVVVRLVIHPIAARMNASYTLAGYQEVTPKKIWENGKMVGYEYTWGAYQMALGNAEAGAFKRDAAQLGNQFGLSLYEKDEEEAGEEAEASVSGATTANVTPIRNTSGKPKCEHDGCGREITDYTSRTGKSYTVEDMVRFSKRDCDGRILCYTHKQEYQNAHRD